MCQKMFCKHFPICVAIIFQTILINYAAKSEECEILSTGSPKLTVVHSSNKSGNNGDNNNNTITFGENFVDLTAGTKLHLMCNSTEPVLWIIPHPHYEILDETPEHVVIEDAFDKETGKWISHLIINNVIWSDVGYYSCHYNSSKITEENSQNSVYVFVNSSNPEHLFAADNIHDYPHIASVHNKSARINCRPTSRDITITLWKYDSKDYIKLDIGQQYGITYDPKIGFNINRMTLDNVLCMAQVRNITQSITVHVQYSGSNEFYPEIHDNNVKGAFVGDNFTLHCLVRITPAVRTSLDWKSKNLCHPDTGRIIIGDTSFVSVNGVLFLTRNITVISAQKSDEGYYRCLATDFSLESKETKHYIKIHEFGEKAEKSSENVEQHRKVFIVVLLLSLCFWL